MKFLNRALILTSKFINKLAQTTDPVQEQVQQQLLQFKIQDAIKKVKAELLRSFALNDANPDDLVLTFQLQGAKEQPTLSCNLSFQNGLEEKVNAAVAKNQKTYSNFRLGTFTSQLFKRFLPNIPATVNVQYTTTNDKPFPSN